MKEYYVLVSNGYIVSWATIFNPDFQKIVSDESLTNKYDCVKVVDGIAFLDELKEKEVDFEDEMPSDKDIIMEAISDLAENQSVQSEGFAEIGDLVSQLMEGSVSNG